MKGALGSGQPAGSLIDPGGSDEFPVSDASIERRRDCPRTLANKE
jgi:hypothetical protein